MSRWRAIRLALLITTHVNCCLSKSSTFAWGSRRVCWWTSPCATISSALVEMGGRTHGKLCSPDNPDQILESAAAQQIRNYRSGYRRSRQVAFLPSCMSTSAASMANSCACSSSSPTRRQTNISMPLDISHTSKSSVNLSQS
jgi:hypothetical protein